MLRLLTFAGCTINNPLGQLVRERRAAGLFRALGFARTPYSLSPGGGHQLLSLIQGTNPIPEYVWPYCYIGKPHCPDEKQRAVLLNLDAVLVEFGTLTEYVFDNIVLNANRVNGDLHEKISKVKAIDRKCIAGWRDGLVKINDDLRAAAVREILEHYPAESDEDRIDREIISGVRTVAVAAHAVEDCILAIRSAFKDLPLGLSMFHYRYMSRARPVDWPPELNIQVRGIAQRLGLAIYDSASLVSTYGNEIALAEDCRHWKDEFLTIAGDSIFQFGEKLRSGDIDGANAATAA